MSYKKSLALLMVLAIISFFNLPAQTNNEINKTDASGLKQGFWRVTYENGKTRYEGWFQDNKPTRIMKRYFEDGSLKAEMRFDKTGKKAFTKMYYQNGLIAGEGNFIETMRDSIWKFYSFYDSSLRVVESYKSGNKVGLSKKLYYNGNVAEELTYKENKKDGNWNQYYEDGTQKLKATYINDNRDGEYTIYYPSGKPEIIGYFKNNLMEGDWKYLGEEGNVNMTVHYIAGTPQNTKEMEAQQSEFFKKLEENKGKFPEPDETNMIPMK